MDQWYALNSKPQAEYHVAAVLRQRGFQIYLPETEYSQGQIGPKKKPFFPGYLFIKVNLAVVSLSDMRWTPGLRHVVAIDNQPVPLSDDVIQLIQRKLEVASGQMVSPFKPGDLVRISEGPFRDMVGIFDGPTTPAKRVKILLNVLGQANRVEINAIDLATVPPDTESGIVAPKRPRRTRGRGRQIMYHSTP